MEQELPVSPAARSPDAALLVRGLATLRRSTRARRTQTDLGELDDKQHHRSQRDRLTYAENARQVTRLDTNSIHNVFDHEVSATALALETDRVPVLKQRCVPDRYVASVTSQAGDIESEDILRNAEWLWQVTARVSKRPPKPPAAALQAAPDLAAVLTAVADPRTRRPSRSDWPVYANREEMRRRLPGPLSRVPWDDNDTCFVASAITAELDEFMCALIDRWRGLWPDWTARPGFAARCSEFVAALDGRYDNDRRFETARRDGDVWVRDDWVFVACTLGLWDVYRQRRPWTDYTAQVCVVCGRKFPPESLRGYLLDYGPPAACEGCCTRAATGHQHDDVDVAGLLRQLADLLGYPPPSSFRDSRDVVAVSGHRDALLAVLVALPDAATCAEVLGVGAGPGQWLGVLQAAGVVGDAWKMPRGVMTVASDGHLCRSFGELAVENYLIGAGIGHECEPSYPAHEALNPNGRLRADWVLDDGRWVEYAGMMSDTAYAAKMAVKVELAAVAGIDLIVVVPEDLRRLNDVFAPPASEARQPDSTLE